MALALKAVNFRDAIKMFLRPERRNQDVAGAVVGEAVLRRVGRLGFWLAVSAICTLANGGLYIILLATVYMEYSQPLSLLFVVLIFYYLTRIGMSLSQVISVVQLTHFCTCSEKRGEFDLCFCVRKLDRGSTAGSRALFMAVSSYSSSDPLLFEYAYTNDVFACE